jgi:hypothetical protein
MVLQNDIRDYIHIYQIRQLSQELARNTHSGTPSHILQLVKDSLADFTDNAIDIGVFDNGSGHSVVPYRVERVGNIDRIFVYDNNHPNDTQRFIEIDVTNEQWSYNIFGQTVWSGVGSGIVVGVARHNFPASLNIPLANSPFGMSSPSIAYSAIMVSPEISPLFIDGDGRRMGIMAGELIEEIPGATIHFISMYNPDMPDPTAPIVYQLPITTSYSMQAYGVSDGEYTMVAYAAGVATKLSGVEIMQGSTDEVGLSAGLRQVSLDAVGNKEYCYFFANDNLVDASRSFNLCTTTALGESASFSIANDNNSLIYRNNGQANDYMLEIVQTGQLAGTQILTGNLEGNNSLFITATPGDGPGGSEWVANTGNAIYLPLVVRNY